MMQRVRFIAAALLCAWCAAAWSQAFPARPLRIVVPFPAGGPTDIVTRMIAVKLTEVMGQPVAVENRAGANGLIGVDSVAKSAPEQFAAYLKDDIARWARLAQSTNIEVDLIRTQSAGSNPRVRTDARAPFNARA